LEQFNLILLQKDPGTCCRS